MCTINAFESNNARRAAIVKQIITTEQEAVHRTCCRIARLRRYARQGERKKNDDEHKRAYNMHMNEWYNVIGSINT